MRSDGLNTPNRFIPFMYLLDRRTGRKAHRWDKPYRQRKLRVGCVMMLNRTCSYCCSRDKEMSICR